MYKFLKIRDIGMLLMWSSYFTKYLTKHLLTLLNYMGSQILIFTCNE